MLVLPVLEHSWQFFARGRNLANANFMLNVTCPAVTEFVYATIIILFNLSE